MYPKRYTLTNSHFRAKNPIFDCLLMPKNNI